MNKFIKIASGVTRRSGKPKSENAINRFIDDESGNMTYFAISIAFLMMMVGGIGVDLMQTEMNRTRLQGTLDRAVLAAAALNQELEPDEVIRDYFAKSDLADNVVAMDADKGLNYRWASATASIETDTLFMHLLGRDTITTYSSGLAEERIGSVEISMVLDVSGSMRWNSRLTNLKIAAKDFVDTLTQQTEDGKLSISIVPYATQVSLPDEFFQHFTVSQEHSYSNCVNFSETDFNSTSINTLTELQRTMHFDPWDYMDGRLGVLPGLVSSPVCENAESREAVIMQKDADALKTYIDNMFADGNTSIDVGMKWGTALLDPAMQPVISQMVIDEHVPADFSSRPSAFGSGNTLKVIVLMTDGENTSQYYINEDYRTEASNIWWNQDQQYYSVYDDASDSYYWPEGDRDGDGETDAESWEDHAYGNQEAITYCARYRKNGTCRKWKTIPPEPGEAVALDYPDLWAYTTLKENVEKHYEPWMDNDDAWSEWVYGVRSQVYASTKDARARAICDAAKAQDIIVFTIGFEAPANGVAVLQDCASSAGHYFDVDGLEIADAFSAIAASIRQLRLTQ